MGNNCSCKCSKVVSATPHCQARAGMSNNRPTTKPSDSKKIRFGRTPPRHVEVIIIESSDSSSDDDHTTIEWEGSSSSSDDEVQIVEQRIRKVARNYQTTDKMMPKTVHTRIFTNGSTGISTGPSYARFQQSSSRTRFESQAGGYSTEIGVFTIEN